MPTYEYACKCGNRWDVIKRMAAYDDPENCPKCSSLGDRQVVGCNIDRTAASGWANQQFHPGLGCYTRSDQHARKIAKSRGLEEVGNEPPEKIHAAMERAKAETSAQRWADADREKQYGD